MQVSLEIEFLMRIPPGSMSGLIIAHTATMGLDYEFISDSERGHSRQSWQESLYCFNNGSWFRPDRTGFGLLRMLNEHVIAPGCGSGLQPRDNMEILSIPIKGSMAYCDSIGNREIISPGEMQLLSSGTGMLYSESNPDLQRPLHLIQIGLLPFRRNLPPRYEKIRLNGDLPENKFFEIAGPDRKPHCLQIRQTARVYAGSFRVGSAFMPDSKEKESGTFLFLIRGKIRIFDKEFQTGDSAGYITNLMTEAEILQPSLILLIQVPMNHRPRN